MKQHADIKIYGHVQGVMFRFSSRVVAEHMDVYGYAENLPDGTVHIEAEAEKENLERFITWCRRGPEDSQVEKVEVKFSERLKNFQAFESVRSKK